MFLCLLLVAPFLTLAEDKMNIQTIYLTNHGNLATNITSITSPTCKNVNETQINGIPLNKTSYNCMGNLNQNSDPGIVISIKDASGVFPITSNNKIAFSVTFSKPQQTSTFYGTVTIPSSRNTVLTSLSEASNFTIGSFSLNVTSSITYSSTTNQCTPQPSVPSPPGQQTEIPCSSQQTIYVTEQPNVIEKTSHGPMAAVIVESVIISILIIAFVGLTCMYRRTRKAQVRELFGSPPTFPSDQQL